MTATLTSTLVGAAAMASLVVALFFLRFWRQTRDSLFFWFAIAFATDSATRLIEGLSPVSDEREPLVYLPRLDVGVDVLWTHLNAAYKGAATLAANGARPAGPYTIDDQDVVSVMFRIQRNFLP